MSWELIFDHDFNPLTTTSVPWKVTAGPQAGGVILIDRLYAKTTNRLEE